MIDTCISKNYLEFVEFELTNGEITYIEDDDFTDAINWGVDIASFQDGTYVAIIDRGGNCVEYVYKL